MTSRPSVGIQRPRQRSTSGSVPRPPNGGAQQSQNTSAGGASDRVITDTVFDGGRTATLANGRLPASQSLNLQLSAPSNCNSPDAGGGGPSLGASDGGVAPSLPRSRPASRGKARLRPGSLSGTLSMPSRAHPSVTEAISPEDRTRPTGSQSPPPMPVRPGKQPPRQARKAVVRSDAQAPTTKKDSRPKPYVLEAPPMAPHLRQESMFSHTLYRLNSRAKVWSDRVCRLFSMDREAPRGRPHRTNDKARILRQDPSLSE
jgi:hypothetical protein